MLGKMLDILIPSWIGLQLALVAVILIAAGLFALAGTSEEDS